MRPKRLNLLTALAAILLILPASKASEPDVSTPDALKIDRGRLILETGSFLAPAWNSTAWKTVVETARPVPVDGDPKTAEPMDAADNARMRFGLHPAPFPNGDLPMGLRPAWSKDGRKAGLQIDCLICHGGSIGGQSYVGLGNTTLDFQQFLNAMTRADSRRPPLLTFNLNSGRGTVNAGQLAIVLFSLRNPDLSLRQFPLNLGANLPEQDVPAWWTLKKKSTLYLDARTDGDSARSIMQFYLGELSENQFSAYEPAFADLLAYVKSLEAPKYPFPVDESKALAGKAVFEKNCSECHGTYGPDGTYPDLLVPLNRIGTDRARAEGVSGRSIDHYNATWFGQVHPVDKSLEPGYKAPPLDGVWATAPYLHNGSVPTLYALLKSDARPDRFLRQPSTSFEHYDRQNVGWKVRIPESVPEKPSGDPFLSRSLFDSSRYGLGNKGHTFGDKLSESERMAVIEYLKTL
ncbi:c-type cytochrome [bacterium]|nr:c-type cytochrome [bacterium]